MLDLGKVIAGLARPGGLDVFGPVENVWLTALGIALIGPLAALVAPRLCRALGLLLAPLAMALGFVATYRGQRMLALGLITVAITSGFVTSWSKGTLRDAVGPRQAGSLPRRRVRGVALSRAQGRSFDYLVMRNR
jgi:asparagine N-glycosylation enzyme membrane subunit Stt3